MNKNITARLNNKGPHLDCYRGLVRLHDDGSLTWVSSGISVQEYHFDFLTDIKAGE